MTGHVGRVRLAVNLLRHVSDIFDQRSSLMNPRGLERCVPIVELVIVVMGFVATLLVHLGGEGRLSNLSRELMKGGEQCFTARTSKHSFLWR